MREVLMQSWHVDFDLNDVHRWLRGLEPRYDNGLSCGMRWMGRWELPDLDICSYHPGEKEKKKPLQQLMKYQCQSITINTHAHSARRAICLAPAERLEGFALYPSRPRDSCISTGRLMLRLRDSIGISMQHAPRVRCYRRAKATTCALRWRSSSWISCHCILQC